MPVVAVFCGQFPTRTRRNTSIYGSYDSNSVQNKVNDHKYMDSKSSSAGTGAVVWGRVTSGSAASISLTTSHISSSSSASGWTGLAGRSPFMVVCNVALLSLSWKCSHIASSSSSSATAGLPLCSLLLSSCVWRSLLVVIFAARSSSSRIIASTSKSSSFSCSVPEEGGREGEDARESSSLWSESRSGRLGRSSSPSSLLFPCASSRQTLRAT